MKGRNKDKQTLIRIVQKHGGEWLELIPVMTGNRAGVVDAGFGKIWVRFQTGIEARVLNGLAPIGFDRHIRIGRLRSQPSIWRVAEVRETYLEPASNNVRAHHEQHEFNDTVPAFDIAWINRKQVISATMFVSDSTNFLVRVIGGLFPIPGGWAMAASTDGSIAHPDIDLSGYVPSEGALYVSIETDSTGALVPHYDLTKKVGAPELLTFENVPVVPAGNRLIGFALLYESQTALLNQHIYVPGLFMTDYATMDLGYQINNADAGVPTDLDKFGFWSVVDEVLRYITWEDLLGMISAEVTPTTRWVPLANGDPSDPSIIFDAYGNVIMIIEDI